MNDVLAVEMTASSMPSIQSNKAHTNGIRSKSRADETSALLQPVLSQLVQFLASADSELEIHRSGGVLPQSGTSLVPADSLSPKTLLPKLQFSSTLLDEGLGQAGLMKSLEEILAYSVNTSAPGFLDKLYASPLPPGIAAEVILAVLNTNLHVYQVSPVLTLIEKTTTKALANLFGFNGPRAGGISVQGGSASNLTSVVVARNTLFPKTKSQGNAAGHPGNLTLFTSAHGHYSIEKAAQALGMGSKNVIPVPVDGDGMMIPAELERLIIDAESQGNQPFYINATAGSTVLGSFDPFGEIAMIAKRHRCWFHVDGAWGGSFVFAERKDLKQVLTGIHKADSIAINPHKMLGVPVTCSFLLTRDMRLFEAAMTLKAGYLFHDADIEDEEKQGHDDETTESKDVDDIDSGTVTMEQNLYDMTDEDSSWTEPNDLADLTLQCGRRGDSLKFFLSWQYYGTSGYREKVERAYDTALYLSQLVDRHADLGLALGKGTKPQCLQVCFYYMPGGRHVFGTASLPGYLALPDVQGKGKSQTQENMSKRIGRYNTMVTSRITKALIAKGFLIDYAPALEGREDEGSFFRVVVNISTIKETAERLVVDLCNVGDQVVQQLRAKHPSTGD